jgi:hypothetical protein
MNSTLTQIANELEMSGTDRQPPARNRQALLPDCTATLRWLTGSVLETYK